MKQNIMRAANHLVSMGKEQVYQRKRISSPEKEDARQIKKMSITSGHRR